MPCGATQEGWVMVEISDKMWSTGEGNGKPVQYSCLENPTNSMKRQKDMTLEDELFRSVGAQYTTGEKWRNNSRKNEETEPKQNKNKNKQTKNNKNKNKTKKQTKMKHPVVDVTGHGNKSAVRNNIA